MGDIQRAIQQVLAARTPEEIMKIVEEQPEIVGPDAERAFSEEEKRARESGNVLLANALASMRTTLSTYRKQSADFKLPQIPGSHVAAGLINVLILWEGQSPVPSAILTGSFHAVMAALRAHGEKHRLRHLLERLDALDKRVRSAARGIVSEPDKGTPDLLATIEQWIEADSWAVSQAILAEHEELLSDDTFLILSLLRKGAREMGNGDSERSFAEHINVLTRARKEGIEAAYKDLVREEEREKMRQRFGDELLSAWLWPEGNLLLGLQFQPSIEKSEADMSKSLDDLAALLDKPVAPNKKRNLYSSGIAGLRWIRSKLAGADVVRAHGLYWRLIESGGSRVNETQEGLLTLIAASEDPASVPFWVDIVNFSRPRDQFTKKRRRLASAALARLVINKENKAALQALRALMYHDNADVRAEAVYYLGQVYLFKQTPIPGNIQAELATVATHDPFFLARFNARNIFRYSELEVPFDNPGGVYTLRVRYNWEKSVVREIEVKSEQTLSDLHMAILDSLDWDSDHLYSFFLARDRRDRRYEIIPCADDVFGGFTADAMWSADNGTLIADEAVLGELGLAVNCEFTYLYDYGDNHQFTIKVIGIRPQADDSEKYPRVVAAHGRSPKQYQMWGNK